jgi:16S rRNA (adenine1518-N6/adenine1519-N6)-dimethyltransferase
LKHLQDARQDWTDWKLVANLPYSVASPILASVALADTCPRLMVVTLQLEVAERLMAKPGCKEYGVLTLLVGQRYEPVSRFRIPSSCFFPAPDVESACIRLRRRAGDQLGREGRPAFVAIVRRSFSQRRKMMAKLLKEGWPPGAIEKALARCGIPPQARAEAVTLDQFAALARMLQKETIDERRDA